MAEGNSGVDKAFSLIEKGNKLETTKNFFTSSKTFVEASLALHELCDDCPEDADEESRQIAQLYDDQSRHYFHKSREVLIEGMKAENEADRDLEAPKIANLSDEAATGRVELFTILFSRQLETEEAAEEQQKEHKQAEQPKEIASLGVDKHIEAEKPVESENPSADERAPETEESNETVDSPSGIEKAGESGKITEVGGPVKAAKRVNLDAEKPVEAETPSGEEESLKPDPTDRSDPPVESFPPLQTKPHEKESNASSQPVNFEEKQLSLEERLAQLNASMPSLGPKSSDDKIKEINQGLKGLGINVYTAEDRRIDALKPAKSTVEQIEDIIAQAADETRFEQLTGEATTQKDEDVSLTDESLGSLGTESLGSLGTDSEVEIDDEDEENVSAPETPTTQEPMARLKNKDSIRKYVVNAQIKLAELVALLDMDNNEEEDHNKEPEDESMVKKAKKQKELVSFDVDHGRHLLLKANKNVGRAVSLWEPNSM